MGRFLNGMKTGKGRRKLKMHITLDLKQKITTLDGQPIYRGDMNDLIQQVLQGALVGRGKMPRPEKMPSAFPTSDREIIDHVIKATEQNDHKEMDLRGVLVSCLSFIPKDDEGKEKDLDGDDWKSRRQKFRALEADKMICSVSELGEWRKLMKARYGKQNAAIMIRVDGIFADAEDAFEAAEKAAKDKAKADAKVPEVYEPKTESEAAQ